MKKTCQLLLVDDDPNFRSGIRRQLHMMKSAIPATVFEASSGEEAVAQVKANAMDCVLLDQQMPGGPGIDWITPLMELRPNLAIIMVTGVGNEQIAVDAMKRGAMDYLVKGTISPENLQRAVVNAMERVALHAAIEAQREQLIEAEKQRVMIESLGAACHHLGQPATVITTYLTLIKRQPITPETAEMVSACMEAAENLGDILQRLQAVSTYRLEPYRLAGEGEPHRSDEYIVKI